MTTGMPELGSKISLISKADIRYEGRLFTVDPQECTIALASVRSFGTEDRETQHPVPAQNQVYDYILFRGSDIKDIRVVNNVPQHAQPLNDPAIMQLSVPPSLGGQAYQGHPVLGQMAPQMGQFGGGAYGNIGGAMGGLGGGLGGPPGGIPMQRSHKPSELILPGSEQPPPPPVLSPPVVEPPRTNQHHHDLISGGGGNSRSTTPASLGSRKSPTNDQGTQAGGGAKGAVKPIQPPHQRNQQQQQHQRKHSRERKDSRGDGQLHQQQQQNRPMGQRNHQQQQQQQHQQGHHQYNNNQGNNMQQQQQRGGWSNRGQMGGRPRARSRGGFNKPGPPGQPNQAGGNAVAMNHQAGGPKPKNTLKFDNDYDFEQANTEFEELRSKLGKVKLEDGSTPVVLTAGELEASNGVPQVVASAVVVPSSAIVVGEGVADKKDDSGNETGQGDTGEEEDHETFYDKSKSFFDKISCEAVERAKGKSQRTDWRTERKLNSETFGVASTRRGHFRGRGGYRGMGYRGGFRGGYRPQRRDNQQGGGDERIDTKK